MKNQNLIHRCNLCDKDYVSQQSLKYHKTHAHVNEKLEVYECDICEKTFHERYYLKTHHTMVHSKNENFKCDICQKGYSLYNTLQLHIRKAHRSHPRLYVYCQLCDLSFTKRCSLKNHEIRCHSNDVKCDICEATFGSVKDVALHLQNVHKENK